MNQTQEELAAVQQQLDQQAQEIATEEQSGQAAGEQTAEQTAVVGQDGQKQGQAATGEQGAQQAQEQQQVSDRFNQEAFNQLGTEINQVNQQVQQLPQGSPPVEALLKQVQGMQSQIMRWGNEVGDMRKRDRERQVQLAEKGYIDDDLVDPVQQVQPQQQQAVVIAPELDALNRKLDMLNQKIDRSAIRESVDVALSEAKQLQMQCPEFRTKDDLRDIYSMGEAHHEYPMLKKMVALDNMRISRGWGKATLRQSYELYKLESGQTSTDILNAEQRGAQRVVAAINGNANAPRQLGAVQDQNPGHTGKVLDGFKTNADIDKAPLEVVNQGIEEYRQQLAAEDGSGDAPAF